MSTPVRGIIFDMDGVLCDSEPFICEAACRMFAENHSVKVDPSDFLPFVHTGENRYLGGVAERHGLSLDLDRDKARTYQIYLEIIHGRLSPLPGATEFIRTCRRLGLQLAVATSADRIKLDGNLKQIGFPPETFDTCVTGTEVQRKKPDPEVFLLAANRIGLTAAQCVVVEDATNGIIAGKAAGCRCLGLTTSYDAPTLKRAGADWIAPDLARLPQTFVRAIFGENSPVQAP